MEVILLQSLEKLGDAGDVVRVKPGYARNYLLPKGLAIEATPGNIRMVQTRRQQQEAQARRASEQAKKLAEKLSKLSLTAPVQVGEEDRVFGSVTAMTIADLLRDQGFDVDKKNILLDEPIKALGVYNVPVKLHHDIQVEVKVYVIKE